MTTDFTRRTRRSTAAIALAAVLAAFLAGCAQSALDPAPSSGTSVPQIDYHSGFYRMQNG